MSRDWVYENLFGLSPDQYNKEKRSNGSRCNAKL